MHFQSDRRERADLAVLPDVRRKWPIRRFGMLVLLFPVLHPNLARSELPTAPDPDSRVPGAAPAAEEVAAPSLPPEPPDKGEPAGRTGEGIDRAGIRNTPEAAGGYPVPNLAAPSTAVNVAVVRGHPRMVASRSHHRQLGLAVLIGDGYRGIFPYDQGRVCGDANGGDSTRVCTNRAPPFVDVRPSFGISRAWDVLLELRFGLRPDFTTKRQFFVMPGFRYWLAPQSQVKFFTTIQLAYDRSQQNQVGVRNEDLAVRNANGLMVDLTRNFGVYAQFGETIGFLRWLSFMVDGGLGVEARFP